MIFAFEVLEIYDFRFKFFPLRFLDFLLLLVLAFNVFLDPNIMMKIMKKEMEDEGCNGFKIKRLKSYQ